MRIIVDNIINPRFIIKNSLKRKRIIVLYGLFLISLFALPLFFGNINIKNLSDNSPISPYMTFPISEEVVDSAPNIWFENTDELLFLQSDLEETYKFEKTYEYNRLFRKDKLEYLFVIDISEDFNIDSYLNIEKYKNANKEYYVFSKEKLYTNNETLTLLFNNTTSISYTSFPNAWKSLDTREIEEGHIQITKLNRIYEDGIKEKIEEQKFLYYTFLIIYSLFSSAFSLFTALVFIILFANIFQRESMMIIRFTRIPVTKIVINSMTLGVLIATILELYLPVQLGLLGLSIIIIITSIYIRILANTIKKDLVRMRRKKNEL